MRKKIILPVFLSALALTMMGFMKPTHTEKPVKMKENILVIPAKVQQVIDQSCYGCHHSGAKSEKAMKALNFDKLTKLTKFKLVGKLQDMADVVSDGDMPPKKFLAKHPEKGLSEKQKNLLINWAGKAAEKIIAKQ